MARRGYIRIPTLPASPASKLSDRSVRSMFRRAVHEQSLAFAMGVNADTTWWAAMKQGGPVHYWRRSELGSELAITFCRAVTMFEHTDNVASPRDPLQAKRVCVACQREAVEQWLEAEMIRLEDRVR